MELRPWRINPGAKGPGHGWEVLIFTGVPLLSLNITSRNFSPIFSRRSDVRVEHATRTNHIDATTGHNSITGKVRRRLTML